MKLARQAEGIDTAIGDPLDQLSISASLPTSLLSSIGLDPTSDSTSTRPTSTLSDSLSTSASITSIFSSSSSDFSSFSSSLLFSPSSSPSLSASSSFSRTSLSLPHPTPTSAPFLSISSETSSASSFPTSYTTRITTVNGVRTTVVSPLPTALVSSSQPQNAVNRIPIIAGATAGLVLLILLGLAAIFAHRRRKVHQALELSGKKKENAGLLDGEGFDDDIVPMRTYYDGDSARGFKAPRPSSPVFMRPRAADSGSLFREEVWPPATTRFEDPVMAGVRASSEVDLNVIVRDIMGPPAPARRDTKGHTPSGSISSLPGASSYDRTSRRVSTYSNAPLLDQNSSVQSFYTNSDMSHVSVESGKRYESTPSLPLPNATPMPFPSGVPNSLPTNASKAKITTSTSSYPSVFSQRPSSVPDLTIPGTNLDAQSPPSPRRISTYNSSPLARLTSEDEKMMWINRKLQTTPPR